VGGGGGRASARGYFGNEGAEQVAGLPVPAGRGGSRGGGKILQFRRVPLSLSCVWVRRIKGFKLNGSCRTVEVKRGNGRTDHGESFRRQVGLMWDRGDRRLRAQEEVGAVSSSLPQSRTEVPTEGTGRRGCTSLK